MRGTREDCPTTYPPPGVQADDVEYVNWKSVWVHLEANPSTSPIGGVVTLTARTSADVVSGPFWTQIYDTATGTRLRRCPDGTVCSVGVGQPVAVADTRRYVAYVAYDDSAYPPADIQATSLGSYTTWTSSGWQLSLVTVVPGGMSSIVEATANFDVGSTSYQIQVFNARTGAVIGRCATATCRFVVTDYPVAFVAPYSETFPPANIQASSNVLYEL